jgi:hypothetical protein
MRAGLSLALLGFVACGPGDRQGNGGDAGVCLPPIL